MLPSEGVELQMGLSSVGDLFESHVTQLAKRAFRLSVLSHLILVNNYLHLHSVWSLQT